METNEYVPEWLVNENKFITDKFKTSLKSLIPELTDKQKNYIDAFINYIEHTRKLIKLRGFVLTNIRKFENGQIAIDYNASEYDSYYEGVAEFFEYILNLKENGYS